MKTNMNCLMRRQTQVGARFTASHFSREIRDAVEAVHTRLMAAVPWALLLASAARADTSLTVGNAVGYPGTSATMPIYLAQGSNVLVSQFEVTYDSTRLTPEPTQSPKVPGQRVKYRDVAPGVRRVLAYSVSSAPSRFTNAIRSVALQPFTLANGQYSGSGPVTPANVVLVRNDETQVVGPGLTAGAIFSQPVFLEPDGAARFFLPSKPGTNYCVQASSNLVEWVNLSTNSATSDFLESSDASARFLNHRYYRLEQKP